MPETQAQPETAQPDSDDGKGGKTAVLADLAAERDKRQALEQQVQQLQTTQKTQTEALAKAFGVKPEETSNVDALAAQVTALQEQFTAATRSNLVLTVANEHGITDKDTIADLANVADEKAMRNLAARLAKAGENSSNGGKPKPDLTQGGRNGDVKSSPADDFATFIKTQLGQ